MEKAVLPCRPGARWYDFTGKADGSGAEALYAGRAEKGPSISDPAMGRLDDAT